MAIDLYSYTACLGTLVIDWANRTYTFAGMDGHGTDEMTVAQVEATFEEHADKPDTEVAALIFWTENEQLAVHDAAGFAGEIEHDRECRDDDDIRDRIPDDWPVRPLEPGEPTGSRCTCGVCGLSWDDSSITSMTPAPSGRCPFESFHRDEEDD
jgi:hypothetical protein